MTLSQLMVEAAESPVAVLCLSETRVADVAALLQRFGLQLEIIADQSAIPGSYWGESEAGLIGANLYARSDTPLHSILHEACHWITCTPARRAVVHTDAADCEIEETATCWLQIVLAEEIPGFGRARALADMDAWGYSFRLGDAQRWFEQDAEDAVAWLSEHRLIDDEGRPRFCVRE